VKEYPSIARSTGQKFREFDAYVFDKLDGSNIRAEWSRKSGWNKYGTRTRLFNINDPDFGEAIPIFESVFADDLTKIAKKAGWEGLTVFMEFWGEQSIAGYHVKDDPKKLTLFDANPYKKGILGPREFLDLFGHLNTAKFLGKMHWTRGFVERVWNGEIEGITCEGVVGKAGSGHDLIMAKAKTKVWIEKVKAKCGAEADKIIDS
jgi:hypothetical protein